MRVLFSTFLFFCLFVPHKQASSLNMFELSLIGVGSGLVYDQYFDKSLDSQTTYSKKIEVLSKYSQDKRINSGYSFYSELPIQDQLLMLDEIHFYNNNYR